MAGSSQPFMFNTLYYLMPSSLLWWAVIVYSDLLAAALMIPSSFRCTVLGHHCRVLLSIRCSSISKQCSILAHRARGFSMT